MGFKIHTSDPDAGWEYFATTGITTKVGTALIMDGGYLTIASGDIKPTYISMHESEGVLPSSKVIPVMRVSPDAIYECHTLEDMSDISGGNKVTISSDGNSVTAVSGTHAEVVSISKSANGSLVRVRFV